MHVVGGQACRQVGFHGELVWIQGTGGESGLRGRGGRIWSFFFISGLHHAGHMGETEWLAFSVWSTMKSYSFRFHNIGFCESFALETSAFVAPSDATSARGRPAHPAHNANSNLVDWFCCRPADNLWVGRRQWNRRKNVVQGPTQSVLGREKMATRAGQAGRPAP